jgi:L-lysine 2,3-aminomutase
MFRYIEETPSLNDIVISGGDSYYLHHDHLLEIASRLLSIPHIRRFRFATKGDACLRAVGLVLTLYTKVSQYLP